jgi:hypothetical protein
MMPTYVGAALHPDLISEAGRSPLAIFFFKNFFFAMLRLFAEYDRTTNSIGAM